VAYRVQAGDDVDQPCRLLAGAEILAPSKGGITCATRKRAIIGATHGDGNG